MNNTDGNGTYSDVVVDDPKAYNSNFDYDDDHTIVSPAATGYYRYKWVVTFEGDVYPIYENTSTILLNRTGHEWTYEFDDGIGKELPLPRADWVRKTIHKRDPELPDSYYEDYEAINGVVLDSSKLRVHHIQPLFLGGDNDYDNLIHLPIALHDSITGWYNGY